MARILNASIDTTLGGENASNEVISSQRAIKTYVDTKYSNLSYTTTCPAITPVSDIATWTVTHNLGSTNVVCSLYDSNGAEILKNTNIDSANQVTLTFNANLDISAGDYKIVVLAGGAVSGGGGGSITVDSSLSTTSTNPVQNKVITNYIQPSLNKFIPSGTVINVKTDGTGDFTKLSDAVNYLTGKWSNGQITIKSGSGTFTESGMVTIEGNLFNIPKLIIKGNGRTDTIINRTGIANWTAGINIKGAIVQIEDLTVTVDNPSAGFCIFSNAGSFTSIKNVNVTGGTTGYHTNSIFSFRDTSIYATGVTKCIQAQNGQVEMWNTTCVFANATTAITAIDGSTIRISGNSTKNFTNVNNTFNVNANTLSSNGFITSNW